MQTNTEKTLTNEQAAHLMKELSARSREPIGNHLTDYEFMAYVLDLFSPDEIKAADQHLDRCPECLDQLEFMYESEPFWNSKEAQQQQEAFFGVAPVVESTKAKVKSDSRRDNIIQEFNRLFTDFIQSSMQPISAFAKGVDHNYKEGVIYFGDNNDPLMYGIEIERHGLVMRFSTKIQTRGNKLTLLAKSGFERQIVLNKLGNELYAEVMFKEDEIQAVNKQGGILAIKWGDAA